MISSGLGSLTWNADPKWPFAAFKLLGYNGSKAILNMMTVQLAWELRDTPINVNTVNPGYTATTAVRKRLKKAPRKRSDRLLHLMTLRPAASSKKGASFPGDACLKREGARSTQRKRKDI